MPERMTTPISKQTLVSFLFSQGFADVRAPGEFYALPSVAWIQDKFAPALRADLKRVGALRYVKAKNNCTKFSRHAAWFAGLCHAKTQNKATDEAELALGMFDFVRPVDGGHSINLAVSRYLDSTLLLVFFEPQIQQIVPPPNIKENTQCIVSF
jgi:hypothetical protein